ncbi:MAG TPA: GapR family DNA-binding domain-containing protein [Rhizomicrobium sp.]
MSNGPTAAQMLRGFVDEIETIEDRIEELKLERDEIYARAKTRGFNKKAIKKIVKERNEDSTSRIEFEEQCELYRVSLGRSKGKPLSDGARDRISKESEAPDDDDQGGGGNSGAGPESQAEGPAAVDLDAARDEGREAAREGVSVLKNPYMAGDPRRAAWDEGWCAESGSDGMDIPDAWKPKKKDKKKKSDGEPDKSDAGEGAE